MSIPKDDTIEKLLWSMDRAIQVQQSDGNWDADPYMHGMLNGMILFRSYVSKEPNPEFVSRPKFWKRRTYLLSRYLWCYLKHAPRNMLSNLTGIEIKKPPYKPIDQRID